jgi:hypothetical protein
MAHSRLAGIWKAGCEMKYTEHKNFTASGRLKAIFAKRYLQAAGTNY